MRGHRAAMSNLVDPQTASVSDPSAELAAERQRNLGRLSARAAVA
jgi:hypothetical protein